MIKTRVKQLVDHAKYKKKPVAAADVVGVAAVGVAASDAAATAVGALLTKTAATRYERQDLHESIINPLQAAAFSDGNAYL
jgi:hypothetical protein